MVRRLELHRILCEVLGSNHVYFQPPATISLKYPCIIYKRDGEDAVYASNAKYLAKKRYSITVVDLNPDSPIPEKIGLLPLTSFDSHFTVNNLNHDVYSTYY